MTSLPTSETALSLQTGEADESCCFDSGNFLEDATYLV